MSGEKLSNKRANDMLLTDYDENKQFELIRKEAALDTLATLVKDGLLSLEAAAAFAGITEGEIEERMQTDAASDQEVKT